VWETTSVTIKYEVIAADDGQGHGSRTPGSVNVPSTATAAGSSTAKADAGYEFDGWYSDAAGTVKVPDAWVTGNATDGYTITPQMTGTEWTAATYYAKFKAGATSYKVWYYMQDVDLAGYTHDTSLDKTVSKDVHTGADVHTGDWAKVADNYLTDETGFERAADNAGADTEVVVLGTGQTVLKVYYDRKKFDVSYEFTGAPSDSVNPSVTDGDVVYGDTVSLPTPSAPGYSFAWSAEDKDGNPVAISSNSFTVPAKAVKVTGTWTVNNGYEVNYDLAGGTMTEANPRTGVAWDATDLDTDGTTAYAPTKKGYRFDGWTYGSGVDYVNGTTAYSDVAGGVETPSVTLKAKWIANDYKIEFNGNGATSGSMGDQTVTFDDLPVTLDANAYALSGKMFKGWATSAADAAVGTVALAPGAPLTANLVDDAASDGSTTATLYAVWGDVSYTVHYNSNGGTAVADRENVKWTATDLDTDGAGTTHAPTKTGYTFVGWTYGTDATAYVPGTTAYSTIAVNDDVYEITLDAKWKANTYTVKFDSNGGTGTLADQMLTYDAEEALSANTFSNPGRIFAGWAQSSTATTPDFEDGESKVFNLSSTQGDTVTLFAVWAEKTYKVVYDTLGGTAIADRTNVKWDTTGLDTDGTTVYAPTKTGFNFSGWTYGPSATEYTTTTSYSTVAGDDENVTTVTLVAVWKNKVYHVVFDDGFTPEVAGVDVWSNDPSATTTDDFARYQSDTTSTDNNIAWDQAGWLPMQIGDATAALIPTRAGYDFAGWVYGAAKNALNLENNAAVTFAMLADNDADIANGTAVITATWTPRTYRVVYQDVRNGAPMTGTESNVWTGGWYDTATASSLTNTMPGYTFIGWTTDVDGNNAFVPGVYYDLAASNPGIAAVPNSDNTVDTASAPTLYAQWKKNVTFGVKVYKEDENGNLVEVDVPTDSFDSIDWTSFEGQAIQASLDGGRLTITSGDPADGQIFAAPGLPTLTGYALDTAQSVLALSPLVADADEPFLMLAFKPKAAADESDPTSQYKVQYLNADGTQAAPTKVVDNWASTGLAPEDTPTKLGYKLDGYGWTDAKGNAVDATTPYYALAVDASGNPDDSITTVSLFVNWIERMYHVNFVDSTDINGNDLAADDYKYIQSSNDAKNPAVAGDKAKWDETVELFDIETAAELANTNHTSGWKFMGWALSADSAKAGIADATDAVFNALFQAQNPSVVAETLATYDDENATNGDGLMLFAVWAKYVPYTVKYFVTDDDGVTEVALKDPADSSKDLEVVHAAEDMEAYMGGTATATGTDLTKFRPVGYELPSGTPESGTLTSEDPADNVVKVVYKQIKDFVLHFDKNAPGSTESEIIADATLNGLTWTSRSYVDATATPTLQGYTLNRKVERWSTMRDATAPGALTFAVGTTYEEIAQAIAAAAGEAVDDLEIRANGLTLYAQWTENSDYKVEYDLNNDKATNPNVLTDLTEDQNPVNPGDLTQEGVSWTADGFYDDRDLDAAPHGYEFAGWNTERDGSGLAVSDATEYAELSAAVDPDHEQQSIMLYAQWKEIEVEITYTTDGNGSVTRIIDRITAVTGTPISTTVDGDPLTSVAVPDPGYHFVKWILVEDGSDASGEPAPVLRTLRLRAPMLRAATTSDAKNDTTVEGGLLRVSQGSDGILHSATYKALFEANPDATLKYDVNGGTGNLDDVTKPFGSILDLSDGKQIKRPYYTLVGWNTAADGTGTTYLLGADDYVLPEDGATLYAMWDINKYTVTIGGEPTDGGSVEPITEDVPYGEKLSPETVEKITTIPDTGKMLTGWTYKMIDAETGEVITGTVNDPSELAILGPVTFEPVFADDPNYVDPNAVDPDAEGDGADAMSRYGRSMAGAMPQTGDATVPAWPFALLALAALAVAVLARRRAYAEGPDGPPGATGAPGASRAGLTALILATALVIALGIAAGPQQALALESEQPATEQTENDNEANNAEAESEDSASRFVISSINEPEGVADTRGAEGLEGAAGSKDIVRSGGETDVNDAVHPVEGDVLESALHDPALATDDIDSPLGNADSDMPIASEAAVEKTPVVAKNTTRVSMVTVQVDRPGGQASAPDVEGADGGIEPVLPVAHVPAALPRTTVPEGQVYLKGYVNTRNVLAAVDDKVVVATKDVSSANDSWNIEKVPTVSVEAAPVYTISSDASYLAVEDSQLRLIDSEEDSALWNIASYSTTAGDVLAIYSASTGAVLGASVNVQKAPYCEPESQYSYPSLPDKPQLRWIAEKAPIRIVAPIIDVDGGTDAPRSTNGYQIAEPAAAQDGAIAWPLPAYVAPATTTPATQAAPRVEETVEPTRTPTAETVAAASAAFTTPVTAGSADTGKQHSVAVSRTDSGAASARSGMSANEGTKAAVDAAAAIAVIAALGGLLGAGATALGSAAGGSAASGGLSFGPRKL